MRFLSRRLVMPSDLNYANSLFGGRALEWIDEEAAIYAICQLDTNVLVTKHIGEISFESPALQGDIVFVKVDPETRLPVPHGKTLKELEQFNKSLFKD